MGAVVWVCLLFLWLGVVCEGADQCYARAPSWNSGAEVRLSFMLSLRHPDTGQPCSTISGASLQHYVAVAWVVDILNNGFIPGVTFDFDLFDDCQNSTYAARNALAILSPHLAPEVTNCSHGTDSLHLGILGPTRSATATNTVQLLRDSGIPMISPSATAVNLTKGDNSPNFLRTAQPDNVQIQVVLETLKQLDWTFVVVLHADDIYGRTAAAMLAVEGREMGVCFSRSIELTSSISRTTVFEILRDMKDRAQDGNLGVVYFGERNEAKYLLHYYVHESGLTGLHWIMSDFVGRHVEVFTGLGVPVTETLTITPSSVMFQDLMSFWARQVNNTYVSEYLRQPASDSRLMNTSQSAYLASTVDAVYAFAVALKQLHDDTCGGTSGICQALRDIIKQRHFLSYVKSVNVSYADLDARFVPAEFVTSGRHFSFNQHGDVVRSDTVLYEVNSLDAASGTFSSVGAYYDTGLQLDTSLLQLPSSLCKDFCRECVDFGKVPMVHIDGDVYIVGIFSIHETDDNDPFMCSSFRSVSSDVIALETFIFAVQKLRESTGIKFGAVAFDDCYSSVRLTSIIAEYFSAVGKPADIFGKRISLNKTVAVIGTLSSGSTIPLAQFFTRLNIPVLSYAASSPDLDDRVNFPYFLRTVPSDVEQAQAMVSIITSMGWEYVSLLYVSNNYGT